MITVTPHAAAHLSLLIRQEPDADQLGIRLVRTTTGCGSSTFSITITEAEPGDCVTWTNGIRVWYRDADVETVNGLIIDCDPATGRFSIFSPRPLANDCRILSD